MRNDLLRRGVVLPHYWKRGLRGPGHKKWTRKKLNIKMFTQNFLCTWKRIWRKIPQTSCQYFKTVSEYSSNTLNIHSMIFLGIPFNSLETFWHILHKQALAQSWLGFSNHRVHAGVMMGIILAKCWSSGTLPNLFPTKYMHEFKPRKCNNYPSNINYTFEHKKFIWIKTSSFEHENANGRKKPAWVETLETHDHFPLLWT